MNLAQHLSVGDQNLNMQVSPIPATQSHDTETTTAVCLYLSRWSGYILQLVDNSSAAGREERGREERGFKLQSRTMHLQRRKPSAAQHRLNTQLGL